MNLVVITDKFILYLSVLILPLVFSGLMETACIFFKKRVRMDFFGRVFLFTFAV